MARPSPRVAPAGCIRHRESHCRSHELRPRLHANGIADGIVLRREAESLRARGGWHARCVPRASMPLKLMRAGALDAPEKTAIGWPAGIVLILAVLILLFVWGWSLGADGRI